MEASPFLSLDIDGLDVDVNFSMDFDVRVLLWRSSLSVSALGHASIVPIKHKKKISKKCQKPRGRIMNKINTSFTFHHKLSHQAIHTLPSYN